MILSCKSAMEKQILPSPYVIIDPFYYLNFWILRSTALYNILFLFIINMHSAFCVASYSGSSLCRKAGREPGRSDHVPHDVLCVVLCVVLIIELLPTLSVLSVLSADKVASSPGSLLKNGGRREPGNIRGKSCRYQSDCRTKPRVHVTFCPLSKKLSTLK